MSGARSPALFTPDGERLVFAAGDALRQYRIARFLGAGASGQVYEVTHAHLGGRFALKVMHLEHTGDARKVERALADGKNAYRIEHANVVKVLDLDCEPSGLVWILTELLEGSTIAELLRRQGGRTSPRLSFYIASEAADGLAAAHEGLVIHRDVKPENLFFTSSGRVKVIDFSFAKFLPDGVKTTQGKILGTPPYVAPEQFRSDPLGPGVDMYALGLTLWRMLAGRHPFEDALRRPQELIRRHLQVDPDPLAIAARLPPYVDAVVQRMVAKDPGARFPRMSDAARALRDAWAKLEDDARSSRFRMEIPPGEPPIPGEIGARREYRAPEPVLGDDPSPGVPSRRVVVPPAPASPLGGTLPLDDPRPGLGGTVPLEPGGIAAVAAEVLRQGAQRAQRATPTDGLTGRGTLVMPRAADAPEATAPRDNLGARESRVAPTQRKAQRSRRRAWIVIAAAAALAVATAAILWLVFDIAGDAGPAPRPSTSTPASAAPARAPAPAKARPTR